MLGAGVAFSCDGRLVRSFQPGVGSDPVVSGGGSSLVPGEWGERSIFKSSGAEELDQWTR